MTKEGWIECTLDELVSQQGLFSDGDWVEKKDQEIDGEVRLIQLADIGDCFFRDKSNKRVTHKWAIENNCSFLKKGDILIARMPDPLGRATIFPLEGEEKYITAVDVAILRTSNIYINQNFLLHLINSPSIRNQIDKLKSGTTRKRISRKNLNKIPFQIASPPEQRAIVAKIEELLSDLDKGVADLKKAQDQLKIYRQGVLKKAFEGEYSENVKIELNRIGDHCKIVSGKAFKKSEYSDDGVRLFQIANVSFNKIVWNKIAHLPKSYLSEEKLKDLVLKEGDLVMALNRPMLNNELKIGILGKSDVPSILYQRVGKFVYDSRINSKYLGYFLQSPVFIKWLSKELQGVNIPFINQSNLLGFSEFPYMDIEFQNQTVQEIESRLSVCDKVDESISVSLEKTKALRQSILKKAFEGNLLSTQEIEKCKTEPDYEPAAVLLEKIKNL